MYSAVGSNQAMDGVQIACGNQCSEHTQHHEAERDSSTGSFPYTSLKAVCHIFNTEQNGVSEHRL